MSPASAIPIVGTELRSREEMGDTIKHLLVFNRFYPKSSIT